MSLTNKSLLLNFEVEEIVGKPVALGVNSINGICEVNFFSQDVILLGRLQILLLVRVLYVVLSVLPVLLECFLPRL